ncbi:helix-turn-helix transcriptional regulator [Streptomyces sp. AP-93]|uniref:helix-turn-helix transcriptional regulator n=1 Tax=Streptomyces sp. AP-93 TaxID=2929048 RepID=UPI002435EACF|nr:helix-turn-helix transcriptional regulator [Streptomyces sp. AP-93]
MLTDQSHRLLRLLLSDTSLDPRAAGRELGLFEDELDGALRQLSSAGLVRRLAGHGDVVMLSPDAALARMVALQEEDARARLAELERAQATMSVLSDSLMRLHAGGAGTSVAHRLVGQREISVALEGSAAQARTEVLSMHPGSPLPYTMLKDSMKRNREVIDRGVTMRSIHLSTMLKVPHGRAHLEELREAGAEVRVASVLPFRLIVVDRAVAYVPAGTADPGTEPDPDTVTALEVRDPDLLGLFSSVFEFCWIHGATTSAAAQPSVEGPNEDLDGRELSLVRMLSQGMKDDAIARSLGISSRTLRRIMMDLMYKLKADSRFQAGAHAVARGWLNP